LSQLTVTHQLFNLHNVHTGRSSKCKHLNAG
jgi:hypothetical protein